MNKRIFILTTLFFGLGLLVKWGGSQDTPIAKTERTDRKIASTAIEEAPEEASLPVPQAIFVGKTTHNMGKINGLWRLKKYYAVGTPPQDPKP